MRTVVLLIGIAAGLILGFARLADAGSLSPTVVLSVVVAVGLTISLVVRQRMAAREAGAAPTTTSGGAGSSDERR